MAVPSEHGRPVALGGQEERPRAPHSPHADVLGEGSTRPQHKVARGTRALA